MLVDDHEIIALKSKVAALEARLEELVTDYRRSVRALSAMDDLVNKHCKLLDTELADASQRVKNIELKYFPYLARDLLRLHKVIGEGEDRAYNPLDFRDP